MGVISTIELSGAFDVKRDSGIMDDIVEIAGFTPMGGPAPILNEVLTFEGSPNNNGHNALTKNDDLDVDDIINQDDDEEIVQMIQTPQNDQNTGTLGNDNGYNDEGTDEDEFIVGGDSDDDGTPEY